MTEEQKSKILKFSIAALLVVCILLSLSGLFMVRSYGKTTQTEIAAIHTELVESLSKSKEENSAEVTDAKTELLKMLTDSDADILRLQRAVEKVRSDVDHINARLDAADIEEVEKAIEELPEEPEEKATKEKPEEKTKEAEEVKPKKRPLWKRILQFWRWF